MEAQDRMKQPKSSDVQCLRCGAMNIPSNQICGRCGANLPLVYDSEGEVFNPRENPRMEALKEQQARRRSSFAVGMILRILVILFAIVFAFWVIRHY